MKLVCCAFCGCSDRPIQKEYMFGVFECEDCSRKQFTLFQAGDYDAMLPPALRT